MNNWELCSCCSSNMNATLCEYLPSSTETLESDENVDSHNSSLITTYQRQPPIDPENTKNEEAESDNNKETVKYSKQMTIINASGKILKAKIIYPIHVAFIPRMMFT